MALRFFVLLLLLAGLGWWAVPRLRGPGGSEGGGSGDGAVSPSPPPQREAAAGAGFAGSEACGECHPAELAAWKNSHHADVQPVFGELPPRADLAIGSSWMQAFAHRDASGLHRFLPRCYDIREGTWRDVTQVLIEIAGPLPAGRRSAGQSLASRSFEFDCSGCHASGVELSLDLQADVVRGRWRGISADCESCHGPGRAHVEAVDPRGTLPRLETLDSRSATAICARCHGGPPTVGDYGPADAPEFVARLGMSQGYDPGGGAAAQVYQAASFLRSPCFREGGLLCADCHPAHGLGVRSAEDPDGLCASCHPLFAGEQHSHHDPAGAGGRCIACHMPRLLDGMLRHQRDHRISVPLPASKLAPDACSACHKEEGKAWAARAFRKWWGEPAREALDAIEAVAQTAAQGGSSYESLSPLLRHTDPFYRATAAQIVGSRALLRDDPMPEVRLAAVRGAQRIGDEDALRIALQDAFLVVRISAWLALGSERPVLSPALVRDVEAFVRQRRDAHGARLALGRYYRGRGESEPALRHLEQAALYAPASAEVWEALAQAYEDDGQFALALRARAKGQRAARSGR